MRVKVYQINSNRDVRSEKFNSYENVIEKSPTKAIDPSIYDEVLNAEVDVEGLESLYQLLNCEGHPLHRGHSLSVSDIVENDGKFFYCQPVGFQEIEFDASLTNKPNNLMKVVYVEPNKVPFITEIEHTLEAEQKAVKGLIEPVYFTDDNVCLICNEEGKLIGMEGNRRIGSSIIAGPFFVCGLTEDDFRGLTDEEVERYMEVFKDPEQISQEDVEADTGFTIYSM